MRIINTDLLKHPLNWVIVILMLILAGFIVDLGAQYHVRKSGSGATAQS